MQVVTYVQIIDALAKVRLSPTGADALFVGYIQHGKEAEVLPVMGKLTPGHCSLILTVLIQHMLENYDDQCPCDGCEWALKVIQDVDELLKARRRQKVLPQVD